MSHLPNPSGFSPSTVARKGSFKRGSLEIVAGVPIVPTRRPSFSTPKPEFGRLEVPCSPSIPIPKLRPRSVDQEFRRLDSESDRDSLEKREIDLSSVTAVLNMDDLDQTIRPSVALSNPLGIDAENPANALKNEQKQDWSFRSCFCYLSRTV